VWIATEHVRVSMFYFRWKNVWKVLKKIPFGVDGHALKYTNEVGILKFRTEEANCNALFRENGRLVRFCGLGGESQDFTSNKLLWEPG